VREGRPPEPATERDVALLYSKDKGSEIEATPDMLDAIERLRGIKAQIKTLETEEETLAKDIKNFIADNAAITLDGKPLATWKKASGSSKTDWKAAFLDVTQAMPEPEKALLVARHSAMTEGSRRFLLK